MSATSLGTQAPKISLTYWELVKRRFLRNRYGVFGTIIVMAVVIIGILAPFFSPYTPIRTDRDYSIFLHSPFIFLTKKGVFIFAHLFTGWVKRWTQSPTSSPLLQILSRNFQFNFSFKESLGISWVSNSPHAYSE